MKNFIIKNSLGEKIGKIIFSEGKFKTEVFLSEDKHFLDKFLNRFSQEGIFNFGEVVLNEPIKFDNPKFLDEVSNQLAKRGYILVKEK